MKNWATNSSSSLLQDSLRKMNFQSNRPTQSKDCNDTYCKNSQTTWNCKGSRPNVKSRKSKFYQWFRKDFINSILCEFFIIEKSSRLRWRRISLQIFSSRVTTLSSIRLWTPLMKCMTICSRQPTSTWVVHPTIRKIWGNSTRLIKCGMTSWT